MSIYFFSCCRYLLFTASIFLCSPPSSSSSSSCCRFDYAVGGDITTLDKASFEDRLKSPREGLGLLTILDDASVKGGKEIEVAIRMRDCGRDCTFALTHVFWA